MLRNVQDMTSIQLSIFDQADVSLRQVKDELLKMEINQMTPIECMLALLKLREKVDE